MRLQSDNYATKCMYMLQKILIYRRERVCRSTRPCLKIFEQGVRGCLKIFMPEIDCDADTGVSQSDFWQVVYAARMHKEIMREDWIPSGITITVRHPVNGSV